MGSWKLVAEDSEVAAVHAALLPNGEVLYFSGNTGPEVPAQARIWNPTTETVRTPPNAPDTDLFCSGHALILDGRVLVVGGTAMYSGGPGLPWSGSKAAYLFESNGGWQRIDDMSFGRWYPSVIALPDGRMLVASGEGEDGARTEALEIYDPFGGWQTLPESANRHLPLYPRLHVLPNGEVACAGQGAETAILNLDTNEWRTVALPMQAVRGLRAPTRRSARSAPLGHPHRHDPGSVGVRPDDLAVLLPPVQSAKVLNTGGGSPATADAQIIDFGDPDPAWRPIAPMAHPRWFPNSALLPDGKLLVLGGGLNYNADPVMDIEIFDPVTESWTLDVPMSVPRLYHSTALLLPDGRVWVAGTDGEFRIELYSPDYLLNDSRPVIFSAPASVTYSQNFHVSMTQAGDVSNVCLIRLSSVTHAFNTEQRYVPLTFHPTGAEELEISAPSSTSIAPQGHYMLFIMNGAGTPAVAPIIQLLVTAPVVEEEEDMARIAELEAELAQKESENVYLHSVVGYLTGDVVNALRQAMKLRRAREMRQEVGNVANEIERHRPE